MEEESWERDAWKRNQGGGLIKEEQWRRIMGQELYIKIMKENFGTESMEESLRRNRGGEIMEVAYRRNRGGGIMEEEEEESWERNHER